MVSKCGDGDQEEWKMTDVYRFHRLKEMMPKGRFPLARIEKIVDSVAGCEMMALLDYFSGYH
jgi:hypothetical protein